jgi:hypothetical protein
MDGRRRESFRSFETTTIACYSGTTSRLGEGIPRFRGCVGYSDRQRTNANVREKLVSASILCKPKTEREAIYSATKFHHYLLGKKFMFHVDHSTLVNLVSKASLTGNLARWTLLLQEYEFDIVHWPGIRHVVADYLSRLESGEAPTGVADDFPDAAVMALTPEEGPKNDLDQWLMDMVYFLSHGILPEKLSKAE